MGFLLIILLFAEGVCMRTKFYLFKLLLPLLLLSLGDIKAMSCSLANEMTPVKNQKTRNTCTAFAINALLERYTKVPLSEQCYIMVDRYSKERVLQRKTITYGISFMMQNGVVADNACPYSYSGFLGKFLDKSISIEKYLKYVSKSAIDISALNFQSFYKNNATKAIGFIKERIISGNPVLAGIVFPDEWYKYTGGVFSLENMKSQKVNNNMDHHAIVFTGFDDNKQSLTFKNSWGTKWGVGGYGEMSYSYFVWAYGNNDGATLAANDSHWPGAICSR